MAEKEEARHSQHYCQNCGAEIRPRNAFCASCGASLVSGSEGPWRTESTNARRRSSPIAALGETVRDVVRRLRSRDYAGDTPSTVLRDLLRRIKGLPLPSKAVGAVVGALLLLTVLSPLGLLAALLLLGASLIGLIVRASQRRSIKGWGIVAVASLALAFAFGGISDALYGTRFSGNSALAPGESVGSGQGDAKESRDRLYDGESPSSSTATSPSKEHEEPVDVYLVARSDPPILGPGYLLVRHRDRLFSAFTPNDFWYESGKVNPNGRLISEFSLPNYTIGDLDRFDYACTYDAADADGGRAVAEACGFSIKGEPTESPLTKEGKDKAMS